MTKRIKEIKQELILTNTVVHQKRPYTCVRVLADYHGHIYDEVGFSKVCWPDWWNDERGVDIATGRALTDIAKRIEQEWLGLVDNAARDYTRMLRQAKEVDVIA